MKLSRHQVFKRAHDWQKLKDIIEAKEISMKIHVEELNKARCENNRLRNKIKVLEYKLK